MEQGTTLIAILHIFVAVLLITIVLLQDSKGGGAGGAFGGGSSNTIFGATGAASFLVKVTRGLAVTFMITCIALTLIATHKSNRSVVDNLPRSVPALPGQPPAGQAAAVAVGTSPAPASTAAVPASPAVPSVPTGRGAPVPAVLPVPAAKSK